MWSFVEYSLPLSPESFLLSYQYVLNSSHVNYLILLLRITHSLYRHYIVSIFLYMRDLHLHSGHSCGSPSHHVHSPLYFLHLHHRLLRPARCHQCQFQNMPLRMLPLHPCVCIQMIISVCVSEQQACTVKVKDQLLMILRRPKPIRMQFTFNC